jgi:hypothetical protein
MRCDLPVRPGNRPAVEPRRVSPPRQSTWSGLAHTSVVGQWQGQLQEGNGRGDAERLPTRGYFEGTRHCGERAPLATPSSGGGATESAKRSEPQVRERDATSPHLRRGASRRGGEKPRGRNTRCAGLVRRRSQALWGLAGVDSTQLTRRRGGHRTNPKRGETARAVSARERGLWSGGQGHEGRLPILPNRVSAGRAENP